MGCTSSFPFDRCCPCGPCGRAAEGSLSVGDRLRNAAIVGDPVAFAKVLHVLSSHSPVKCTKFFDDAGMRDRRGNASERKQGGETALHWAAWSGNDIIVTMIAERALHAAQLGSSLDEDFTHKYTFALADSNMRPKHEKDYCDAALDRRDQIVQSVNERSEDEERTKQAMLAMLPKRSQERKLQDAEKFAMAQLALARLEMPTHTGRTALYMVQNWPKRENPNIAERLKKTLNLLHGAAKFRPANGDKSASAPPRQRQPALFVPLEALAERIDYCGANIERDAFGIRCIDAGVPKQKLREWFGCKSDCARDGKGNASKECTCAWNGKYATLRFHPLDRLKEVDDLVLHRPRHNVMTAAAAAQANAVPAHERPQRRAVPQAAKPYPELEYSPREQLRERVLRKTVRWTDSTGDEELRPHNLFDLVKNLSEEQCIEKLVQIAALNKRIWTPPAGV